MITLQPARPEDAALIAEHIAALVAEGSGGGAPRRHRPATLRWLAAGIASGRVVGELARGPEGEAAGSLALMLLPGGRWALHLYVAPGWRRQGVARRLAEGLEESLLMARLRQRLRHGTPWLPPLSELLAAAVPPETLLRLGRGQAAALAPAWNTAATFRNGDS
ncbi:MAG: GNAT family N-acetyltransferase [Rhodovarius sp.]|nr:GNAT family N-acetyltransferase [Rhodovarius sp.]